jgi:hypothetical protein
MDPPGRFLTFPPERSTSPEKAFARSTVSRWFLMPSSVQSIRRRT